MSNPIFIYTVGWSSKITQKFYFNSIFNWVFVSNEFMCSRLTNFNVYDFAENVSEKLTILNEWYGALLSEWSLNACVVSLKTYSLKKTWTILCVLYSILLYLEKREEKTGSKFRDIIYISVKKVLNVCFLECFFRAYNGDFRFCF